MLLKIFTLFFIFLGSEGNENFDDFKVCDSFAFENKSKIIETNGGKNKTENFKSMKILFERSKVFELLNENVSIECQKASSEFVKSLENLELWALKSIKNC